MINQSTSFKVKTPDGRIWDIPEANLDAAISRGGEVIENNLSPSQESVNVSVNTKPIIMPDGRIWDIPEDKVQIAIQRGGKLQNDVMADSMDVGKFAARTGKSIGAGVSGSIPDMITSSYNIPAVIENAKTPEMMSVSQDISEMNPYPSNQQIENPNLPLIPSVTEAVDKGIDEATGDYTKTPEQEKWFQEGIKFASAVGTGGGLGALAGKAGKKGAETALKFTGSTKPSAIIGGAASGAATQKAHEYGANTVESIGAGVGAGIAGDVVANILNPRNIIKGATSAIGFGKKNLNTSAIEAAERLDMKLPPIAATKGTLPSYAHAQLSKFPGFGDELREKIETASKKFQNSWEKMMDSVGVAKTDLVNAQIDKNYKLMRNSIPEGDTLDPTPMLNAISRVRETVSQKKTKIYSDPTKKLLSYLDEFENNFLTKTELPPGFEKFPPQIQEQILKSSPNAVTPALVEDMTKVKQQINKIMKDRNLFDRNDADTLNFLKMVGHGANDSLEQYGKTNAKFANANKRANKEFAQTEKREALDDVFAGKVVDPKTGEVSYNSLLATLGDRSNQKFLKNNLGEEKYKKLQDFIEVAKSMEGAKRRNPNPSGSATVGAVTALLYSVAHGNIAIPAAVIGSGMVATKLLTSNKFLHYATKFAKQPTEPIAKQLEKIVKESTGMTIQTLQKSIKDGNKDQKED